MLSETSLPVIKATLPVVGENIQEIARRFYEHMFTEHPGLLDGLLTAVIRRMGASSRPWPDPLPRSPAIW